MSLNAACNNEMFTYENIRAMHATMTRLYEAATQLCEKNGLVEVADLLGESPQVVKNWEARGMSAAGMVTAEERIGCRAVWLKNGTPPMTWVSNLLGGKGQISEPYGVPEIRALTKAYEMGGPAKREAMVRLSRLPEHEMGTLLLVLQSIGEKYPGQGQA